MNSIEKDWRSIDTKSLLNVILYSGVLSILFAYLIGFADFYIIKAFRISLFPATFFIISYFIGGQVRRHYHTPHIVYVVIAGVFLFIMAIIGFSFPTIYFYAIETGQKSLIFNATEYISTLGSFFKMLAGSFDMNLVLDVLFIVVGTYVGIRRTY